MRGGNNFSELSLEKKIGQMFMLGFQGKKLSDGFKDFVNKANIGFIILFSRNFESPEQLITLTNEIHSLGDIQPMIFTDQEGGTVCQFGEYLATYVSPMGIAVTGKPENAFKAGRGIGNDLKAVGIDGNIAPVVDVNLNKDNPIIGIRAFSDDPEEVIEYAGEFLRGLHSAEVAAVLKHFPGHGRTIEDSHSSLPMVDVSLDILKESDLLPYYELSDRTDFIMSAHVNFEKIDKNNIPATFSPVFKKILREETGFDGVYMTDCLEMSAIKNNFSAEEIIEGAISGGADVLVSSGYKKDFEFQKSLYFKLFDLVKKNKISRERIEFSYERILRVKKKFSNLLERKFIKNTPKLRANYEEEKKIAKEAILVVQRDNLKKLPISSDRSVGIIEWEKAPSTIPISEARKKSFLYEIGEKYFKKVELLLLPLIDKLPEKIDSFLHSFDEIIVATYSRYSEAEKIQGKAVREILKRRKDAIIVSTGNPYDIRQFPDADEYICTFGFRKVQIEALFETLLSI